MAGPGGGGAGGKAVVVVAPTAERGSPKSPDRQGADGKAAARQAMLKPRAEHGGFRPEPGKVQPRPQEAAKQTPEEEAAEKKRRKSQKTPLVETSAFHIAVAIVTMLNVIFLALEMEVGPGPGAALADRLMWMTLEAVFYGCFTIELVLRIKSGRAAFFKDLWNMLDTILVGLCIFDFFVLVPAGVGGQMRFFTPLRCFRAVRVASMFRMTGFMRELWFIAGGISGSVKALGWVGIVILMVLYVCSVFLTVSIGQNDSTYGIGPSYNGEEWPYKVYFGTILQSMLTLFQVMTFDDWCDDVVRHVVFRQPLMGVFFILFLFIMGFGVLNVLAGIIIENTLAAADISDRKTATVQGEAKKQAVETLYNILVKSDADRTGEISMEEMRAAAQSKVVQVQMERIGLTIEEAAEIFRLLDFEQRGRIELTRFADSCRQLVGGTKRRDLAQVEVTVGALAQHLETLDVKFASIETDIGDLTKIADHFVHNTVRVLTGFDGSIKVPPKPGGSGHRRSGSLPPGH